MLSAISRQAITPLYNKHGGTIHVLLGPKTVGATSGFLATLTLAPREIFLKHHHPHSEEYIYVTQGEITIEGNNNTVVAQSGTGVFIPRQAPHRLHNTGNIEASMVYFFSPLPPAPEDEYILLEEATSPE